MERKKEVRYLVSLFIFLFLLPVLVKVRYLVSLFIFLFLLAVLVRIVRVQDWRIFQDKSKLKEVYRVNAVIDFKEVTRRVLSSKVPSDDPYYGMSYHLGNIHRFFRDNSDFLLTHQCREEFILLAARNTWISHAELRDELGNLNLRLASVQEFIFFVDNYASMIGEIDGHSNFHFFSPGSLLRVSSGVYWYLCYSHQFSFHDHYIEHIYGYSYPYPIFLAIKDH